MLRKVFLACSVGIVLGCAGESPRAAETAPAAEQSAPAPGAPTDRIGVAMSAAPAEIAANATIMDFDASGKLVELRAGTNGWLCLADDTPAAPGDSPDCVDPVWQQWFAAYEKKEPPRITQVGIAYMLKGSLTPSMTDPFAASPPPGADWVVDGPHMMMIVPDPAILDSYSGDHSAHGPYVMYKGTPYAHLMIPVAAR